MHILPVNNVYGIRNAVSKKQYTTPAFKGVQEDVIEPYDEKINNVTGWRKRKKIKALEAEKSAAIIGYALAQERNYQELKAQQDKYEKLLESAKANNEDKEKIHELEIKLKEAVNLANIQKELMGVRRNEGWDRIAGYDSEKAILSSSFIEAVGLEKTGQEVILPNGILFFGPTGNGKTTFAKAFAEQSKCHFRNISVFNSDYLLRELESALKDAKKNYKTDGTRTIILLDEFERFGLKHELGGNQALVANLKAILCQSADEYKTTFFLTTNNPQDIDSILFADSRVPVKVYLDPPDNTNAGRVFEYYLKGKTTNNININNLVEELMANKVDGAYSNSKIKTIVESVFKETQTAKRLMTEGDLIEKIRTTLPDITKDHLVKYKADVQAIIGNVR